MRANRSILAFGLAAAAASLLTAANVPAATVSYDNGTTYQTAALAAYSTFGDMMDGLSVTAYFLGGGSQALAWADTGAGSGGVSGTGWSMSLSGNTFGASWNLTSDVALAGLVLSGASGNTVFDIDTDPGTGTTGSERGWTFETAYTGPLYATYRNIVQLTGYAPVGDLWETLSLGFGGDGGFTGSLSFIADADNALADADVTPAPVPLPAAAPLFLSALAGLGFFAGRRKRLSA
jgi:hypothetical protein